MALTAEQQAQIDIQLALDNARNSSQLAIETRRMRLEAIRMAKETLIENARSKPADSRDVTAADITAFAAEIEAHINS